MYRENCNYFEKLKPPASQKNVIYLFYFDRKHYYQITRREEGFDMSSAPRLDFDKYKHVN
jgi:hypothetical protein